MREDLAMDRLDVQQGGDTKAANEELDILLVAGLPRPHFHCK